MALEFSTSGLGGRGIDSTYSPATSAGYEYNSPISPLSPPSSPVLYPVVSNTSNNTLKNHHQQSISRAQMAKSYLHDIEEMEMCDISTENVSMWNEESIPLFEELGAIAGLDGEQSTDLENLGEEFPEISTNQVIIQHELEKSAQVQSQGFENLTAEFEAILNSLPGSFDISNVESLLSFSVDSVLQEELMDAVNEDSDGNEDDNDNEQETSSIFGIDEITEAELNEDVTDYTAIDTSNWSTDDSSIAVEDDLVDEEVQDYQNQDQDDIDANKSEKILDALLKGDIFLAQTFTNCKEIEIIASTSKLIQQTDTVVGNQRPKRIIISKRKVAEEEIESPPGSPEEQLKPKKRGRKPSSATRSLSKITDKKLRKKEQNKTAATRYRNRKRVETMSTLETENQLNALNEGLKKQTLELGCQIKMIKQLALEVFLSKKKKN